MRRTAWMVALVFVASAVAVFAIRSGDFEYALNPDITTVTITKYYGTNTALDIPDRLDSNLVVRIGNNAFEGNKTLELVACPFRIKSIDQDAFSGCSALLGITLPSQLETIGVNAFISCSQLGRITLPDSVTSLEQGAFSSCSSLSNVVIGSGITVIKNSTFSHTGPLELVVPNTVKTIENQAFLGSQIKSLQLNSGGVESIGGSAFRYCGNLTSVYLGTELKTIGAIAFADCPALESLYLPYTLTSIDRSAVSGCTSFREFMVHPNNAHYVAEEGVLYNLDQSKIEIFPPARPGNYQTPETLREIEPYTFQYCGGLTGITLTHSITNVGRYAFYGCSNMTNATLSTHTQSIGEYAFQSCRKLAAIDIPDSVTFLGDQAFGDCQALAKVTLGSGVTRLGRNAFSSCPALKAFTIPDTISEIGESAFFGCSGLERIMIGTNVTAISTRAFVYCNQLQRIYFTGSAKPTPGSDIFLGVHPNAAVYVFEQTGPWAVDQYAGLPVRTWSLSPTFGVLAPHIDSEGVHLSIRGSDNVPHTIERSTNLVENVWVPLVTQHPESGQFEYVDAPDSSRDTAYYRITRPIE